MSVNVEKYQFRDSGYIFNTDKIIRHQRTPVPRGEKYWIQKHRQNTEELFPKRTFFMHRAAKVAYKEAIVIGYGD